MCYGELKAANYIDKANLFNKYFYSVFLQEQGNDYSCLSHCDHSLRNIEISTSVRNIEISTSEVYDILSTLDVTKAAGIDGINPRILRYCASSLLIPICHLFMSSIITGYIPNQWCIHCIIPIYKSGDKSSVKNYRPISLLCILSKVLERIIYNRMMSFLSNHFTIHQFGFLPGRSAQKSYLMESAITQQWMLFIWTSKKPSTQSLIMLYYVNFSHWELQGLFITGSPLT